MDELQLERRIQDLTHQIAIVLEDLEEMQHAMSHDMRAPLRAVHGFCKTLQEDYGGQLDKEANRVINTIVENAGKVNHLIDHLINYSRIGRKHV